MLSRRLAGLLFVCTLLAAPALADPACTAGSIPTTTCDIGDLRFTFGSLYGYDLAYNFDTSDYDYYNDWSASDFGFAPVSNGFNLRLLSRPTSITAPVNGYVYNDAILPFSILALNGRLLTGGDTSGGDPSASGDNYSYSYAGNVYLCGVSPCLAAYDAVVDSYGTITNYTDQNFLYGPPFSSNFGYAKPFTLYAENGNSAGWSGSTTFTFSLTDPIVEPIPEPATLLLLGSGLLGVAGYGRKKLFRKT